MSDKNASKNIYEDMLSSVQSDESQYMNEIAMPSVYQPVDKKNSDKKSFSK